MPSGMPYPDVAELVMHHPERDEFLLIMIEDRPWTNSPEQIDQLVAKINSYAAYVLDEGFLVRFPEAAGKPVRIQLDCCSTPDGEAAALVEQARQRLGEYGIGFEVSVYD